MTSGSPFRGGRRRADTNEILPPFFFFWVCVLEKAALGRDYALRIYRRLHALFLII